MDGSEIDGFQIRVDYSITDSAHKSVLKFSHHWPCQNLAIMVKELLRPDGCFAGQPQEFISTMEKQLVQVGEGDLSSEAEVTSGEGDNFYGIQMELFHAWR